MSRHTCGPWNVMPSKRGSLLHIETDATAPVAGLPICSVPGNMPNALLIAAAPQLLEALRIAWNSIDRVNHPAAAAISAAIAAATGDT